MSSDKNIPGSFSQKTITIIHQGLNAKRLREALGISQEYIGKQLDFVQQTVSLFEEKPLLDDYIIDVYVSELGCQRAHITNMKTEVPADNTIHLKIDHNDNITFNPLEKVMELSGQVVLSEKEKHEILKEVIADERERNKTDREFFNGVLNQLSDVIRNFKDLKEGEV